MWNPPDKAVVRFRVLPRLRRACLHPPKRTTQPVTSPRIAHRERLPEGQKAVPAYKAEQYLKFINEGELAQTGYNLLVSKSNVHGILHARHEVRHALRFGANSAGEAAPAASAPTRLPDEKGQGPAAGSAAHFHFER